MKSLVKSAQEGDDQAFLELFQKYETYIYRMAFIYVKNEADALDVVQETAYRSFKSIKNLKKATYFKSWLIRIAINCSLDLLKKEKRTVTINQEEVDYFSQAEDENLPLELTLQEFIHELDEQERLVVFLRFYDDFTFRQIADTLDIPLGSAKTILYRSIDKLRARLEEVDFHE